MLIDIGKVKVEDRIRKDFGNIKELADDIKENGLINPPVVIQEIDGSFTLLAGERRLRALKSLGYQQIEVRTWATLNDEQKLNIEISENETRKDFSKSERIDYARRLERIESLKAKERILATQNNNSAVEIFPQQGSEGKVRDIVAEKLNIGSGKQYEKEKFIVENKSSLSIEDFTDWDEGKLSTNKVFLKIKEQLKEKENQIAGYEIKLKKINQLENDINNLNKQLANRPIIEKEVKPNDYDDLKKQSVGYKSDYVRLKSEYDSKVLEITQLKQQIKAINDITEEEQYNKKLKDGTIFFCSRVSEFIEKVGGYVWLSENINQIPEYERKSYLKAIEMVKNWALVMEENINNNID